jgi:hypothetical protein
MSLQTTKPEPVQKFNDRGLLEFLNVMNKLTISIPTEKSTRPKLLDSAKREEDSETNDDEGDCDCDADDYAMIGSPNSNDSNPLSIEKVSKECIALLFRAKREIQDE